MGSQLEAIYREVNAAHLKKWLPESSPNYRHALQFALNRLEIGSRILHHLTEQYQALLPKGSTVLDLGSGNGGLSFPFAAQGGCHCIGLEPFVHPEQVLVAKRAGLPYSSLTGNAQALPLADRSIDAVLYAEVIEHLEDAGAAGKEVRRVLRPGGLCVITTPPRLRFLLRRDPHYRVMGLLCLPASGQRWVIEKLLKRAQRFDVTRIYWSVSQILRTLPGLDLIEVTGPLGRTPLRQFDWEWIIARRAR